MKFIWAFLVFAAAAGFGYHVGREYQHRKAKRQADEIHAYVRRVVEASGKLREAIGTITQAAVSPAEGVARGRLPIKRGETDRALKNGEIAFYKDGDGTS